MIDDMTQSEFDTQPEAAQMRIVGEVIKAMQRTTDAALAMTKPLLLIAAPADQNCAMAQMIASHAMAACDGDLIKALAWCDLLHETVKIVAEIYSEIAPIRSTG